jgi:hypothetical protein
LTETKKIPLQGASVLEIGIWNLDIVCYLEFEIWNFSPINTFLPPSALRPEPYADCRFHFPVRPFHSACALSPMHYAGS